MATSVLSSGTTAAGIHFSNKSLSRQESHEDMAHPFFRHLCAIFLSAVCFVSIVKLNNKSRIQTLMDNSNFNSSDYFDVEEEYRPARLQLNNLQSLEASDRNESVFFLGLFELSTKLGERSESKSEVAAAQLAVDHVNKLGVLPGYFLRLLINDTKVRNI